MKLSWLFIMLLPSFIGLLNFQNSHAVTVHFLTWTGTMSTALVIELTTLLGVLVGIALGVAFRRGSVQADLHELPDSDSPFGNEHVSKWP